MAYLSNAIGCLMRDYTQCRNIRIDGDEYTEGFLGLDWFPSGTSSRKKDHFEVGVVRVLDLLRKTMVGWSVLIEIYYLPKRTMFIRPYHPTPAAGVCNATATPSDPAAATLRDTTALGTACQLP